MGFFGFFNVYALRANISVAIIPMVNVTYVRQLNAELQLEENITDTVNSIICPKQKNASHLQDGPFNWDEAQQGYILASFFYGYMFTQLPGGILAERYGGKLVLLFGIGITSVLTLLTPVVTEVTGLVGILIVRILEGAAEGVSFPSMHVMLTVWAHPQERGKMATFVYSGAPIGMVVSMPVCGILCKSVNWESAFYVYGALGVLWSIMWTFLVYDKPSKHPWITARERTYIETSQVPQRARGVHLKIPWLKIVTSPPVYAVSMGNFAHNWGNFNMMTVTPMFLSYILKFDLKSSGATAGTPYLTMWFGMLFRGAMSDFLISRHIMSVTWVRKFFNTIGFGGSAACLSGIGYVKCEKEVAVVLLVIIGFCLGLTWSGWGVNHIDIAPPFAGTLFGVSNCFSSIPGFATPSIVGVLTRGNQTHAVWRTAFFISVAVLLFAVIISLIFGTGVRQKWSYLEPRRPPTQEAETQVLLNSAKRNDELGGATPNKI